MSLIFADFLLIRLVKYRRECRKISVLVICKTIEQDVSILGPCSIHLFVLFYYTGTVPQTLGEAMNVEKAEANYENTFENVYGMYSCVNHLK